MTWGECKEIALRKMFASDGGRLDDSDPGNADYIAAMPAAANEAMEGAAYVDMADHAMDFRSFGGTPEAYLVKDNGLAVLETAALGKSVLQLPKGISGTVRVFYNAAPEHITQYTNDDEEMPLSEECNVLIPLYMAGELYKDDDVSLATVYMNEFESRLGSLAANENGYWGGSFTSVTGWW